MAENERNDANKGETGGKGKKKLRILLRTFGCQMNEYDSELIRSILAKENFQFVNREEDAEVILLNTCSVRESATRKVYGHIHALRYNLKNSDVLIGVLGCIASDRGEKILENKNLNIDFAIGPDSYRRLPQIIKQACESRTRYSDAAPSDEETYSDIRPIRKSAVNAWIAIMRGCNNFCSFCVVPYVRGRERSRSPDDIVAETKRAAESGFRQVTLLGQNVNSYRYADCDFVDLLKMVSGTEGIERIRFMSPHPKDFPEKLLKLMVINKKICKHIHLPLQAGGDKILRMMNRSYTKGDFINLAALIKRYCPDIALTTDIIVGFPTETDAEFEDTVSVMRKARFDSAFIFKYSPRKETVAAKNYPDDVPEKVKTKRIVRLNEMQKQISLEKNQAAVGRIYEVLIEQEATTKSQNDFQGRTDGHKLVILPAGDYRNGQFVNVEIDSATPHALQGHAVNTPSKSKNRCNNCGVASL